LIFSFIFIIHGGFLHVRLNPIYPRFAFFLSSASRLIRRRVPAAGHLMTPRRLWLNKIPTQCDVVVEFPGRSFWRKSKPFSVIALNLSLFRPENAPDDALRWLLNRVKAHQPEGLGLQCLVRVHESTKRTAFYISAPINILFKAAEEYRLPKRLRTELGGALRDFTTRESHCFEHVKDEDGKLVLFTSQERQWLVFQVLQSLRATSADATAFQGRAAVEEGQSIVAAWQESGIIEQLFPLHETNALTQLKAGWVKKFFAPQPLGDCSSPSRLISR
jgi:anoctamin-8